MHNSDGVVWFFGILCGIIVGFSLENSVTSTEYLRAEAVCYPNEGVHKIDPDLLDLNVTCKNGAFFEVLTDQDHEQRVLWQERKRQLQSIDE